MIADTTSSLLLWIVMELTYIQSLWVLVQVLVKSDGIFHIKRFKKPKYQKIPGNPKNIINQYT
jgi:hypothetical protein